MAGYVSCDYFELRFAALRQELLALINGAAPVGSLTFDSVTETDPAQTDKVTKSWVEGSGASDVELTLSWANLTPNSVIELELPFGPTSADVYKETVAGGLYSTIPTASGTLSIKPKNYLQEGGGTCVLGTYTWTIRVDGKTATRQVQIV